MDFLDKLKTHLKLKQEILDHIGFSEECLCTLTDNTDQPWKRSDYEGDYPHTRIYRGEQLFAVGYYDYRYGEADDISISDDEDPYEMDIYELKIFDYTKEIK